MKAVRLFPISSGGNNCNISVGFVLLSVHTLFFNLRQVILSVYHELLFLHVVSETAKVKG